jgi:hypothetical protein
MEPEGKVGSKRLYEQFPRSLDEGLIDKEVLTMAEVWRH